MFNPTSLDVEVTATVNIFPSARQTAPISRPLSILDNISASFTRSAAIWYYDAPSTSGSALSSEHLQMSLMQTLNAYPQWCGRLSFRAPKTNGNHNERYQRIWVTYNTPNDIGVSLSTATSPRTLSDYLPSTATRKAEKKAWEASQIPSTQLFPPNIRLSVSEDDKDAPNVIIQSTAFACGSSAIAISITHCFADAVSLAQFAKDWSTASCAILSTFEVPTPSPVFDPQLLDAYASGKIDSSVPDGEIQRKARSLPQHRFDWYQPVPGHSTNIPKDWEENVKSSSVELSPSNAIPWHQWDRSLPVSQRVLHFSSSEILAIYTSATTTPIPSSNHKNTKVSKHDALLAHIWTRINLARNITPGTQTYLNLTFGLRPRMKPPLPDGFLGSPITHAAIPYPPAQTSLDSSAYAVMTPALSSVAKTIREALDLFTAEALADHLHDAAFEIGPQRLWRACLGKEHILLTTWTYSRVHSVDLGYGLPKYVEAIMPACDGLVEVMEAPGIKKFTEGGGWIDDGIDVTVFLEREAMARLLGDERLFGESL